MENKSAKKRSVGNRMAGRAKTAAKKVIVRKVSRKIVANVHVALMNHLEASDKTKMLAEYLNNPLGKGLVSALLAVGMESLPLPESIRDAVDSIKDDLVDELTIQAFDSATVPVENVMALLLPAFKDAMMPLLSAPEILQLKETNG